VNVDFSVHTGSIRPLHGINKGPLAPGGMFDLIEEQKQLGIPFTRLHDCGWPNPYVVDHHVVFPNPAADPALAENYDFRLTDEYIDAVRKTGAEPIYRLGESIEHTSVKRYVHPPANAENWAAVCIGIIRHYNEGWANGFHYNIRYWEIWNEPENRTAMWSGTDEDYLQLYRTAATAIKKQFPTLRVGGPALGASGSFVNGEFVPPDFAVDFLAMCRNDNVPLNFFSWHCYTADPSELVARSRAIRQLLDSKGFTETESHLNESGAKKAAQLWADALDSDFFTAAVPLQERVCRNQGSTYSRTTNRSPCALTVGLTSATRRNTLQPRACRIGAENWMTQNGSAYATEAGKNAPRIHAILSAIAAGLFLAEIKSCG
jgi:hypothetical protein